MVVPFLRFIYLESYKVFPKRNYYGMEPMGKLREDDFIATRRVVTAVVWK